MSDATLRPLTGFRYVEIRYQDTLQAIAMRELGDAARWADLITINGLVYPYLTGDSGQAGPGVKLYGQTLLVPAATVQVSATADPERVFGVDVELDRGFLDVTEGGDIATVAGRANLRQALGNRIATPLQELIFHPLYGCGVHSLKGEGNGPTTATLAAQYVRDAMLSDKRIREVTSATATVQGDAVSAAAEVQPVTGTTLDLSDLVV